LLRRFLYDHFSFRPPRPPVVTFITSAVALVNQSDPLVDISGRLRLSSMATMEKIKGGGVL